MSNFSYKNWLLLFLVVLFAATRKYWINNSFEILFALFAILIAGVPHGSLDYEVAKNSRKGFNKIGYILIYLLLVSIYLFVWYILPGIAFVFFLLITAWHFGETDFNSLDLSYKNKFQVLVYGISITFWILLNDPQNLVYWVEKISSGSLIVTRPIDLIIKVPSLTWFFILSTILILQSRNSRVKLLNVLFFLVSILLLKYTSLLVGFVIYFTGWHSFNAIDHIRLTLNKYTSKQLFVKAILPTVASMVILLFIFFLGDYDWIEQSGLHTLFILLSILTVPHMIEMHKLYQNRSSD